jgi:predicted DNA-binding protein (MmcQ/YjbR family)
MHGDALQQYARDRAKELPSTGLEHPFGRDWEVFKARDKVCMLMTESYRLVVANLPRAQHPVDPATFGTREP